MGTASIFHHFDDDEIERSSQGLVVVHKFDCIPWGELPVRVITPVRDQLTESVREALEQLAIFWPTIWNMARPALEAELEVYGYLEAHQQNKICLTARLPVPLTAHDPVVIAMKFEPFAGSYDVTVAGDKVLDSGAAF